MRHLRKMYRASLKIVHSDWLHWLLIEPVIHNYCTMNNMSDKHSLPAWSLFAFSMAWQAVLHSCSSGEGMRPAVSLPLKPHFLACHQLWSSLLITWKSRVFITQNYHISNLKISTVPTVCVNKREFLDQEKPVSFAFKMFALKKIHLGLFKGSLKCYWRDIPCEKLAGMSVSEGLITAGFLGVFPPKGITIFFFHNTPCGINKMTKTTLYRF